MLTTNGETTLGVWGIVHTDTFHRLYSNSGRINGDVSNYPNCPNAIYNLSLPICILRVLFSTNLFRSAKLCWTA